MLQLQETRKKSKHLLPKQATFVGSRRDSETRFVSRDLRGDWGDQSPHPYSPPFSSSQNHPRPHPAPHNGEVKAPPGCVPLFVRGSIPNSTSRPPHRGCLRGLRKQRRGRRRMQPPPPCRRRSRCWCLCRGAGFVPHLRSRLGGTESVSQGSISLSPPSGTPLRLSSHVQRLLSSRANPAQRRYLGSLLIWFKLV